MLTVPTILEFLGSDGDRGTDRAGETPYTKVYEELNAMDPTSAMDLVLQIPPDFQEQSEKRWLRFMIALEFVRKLDVEQKSRLSEILKEFPPHNLTARAYVVRQLAYLGCDFRVPWLQTLMVAEPLCIADAFAWAGDVTAAEVILEDAVNRHHITPLEQGEMEDRWRRRQP